MSIFPTKIQFAWKNARFLAPKFRIIMTMGIGDYKHSFGFNEYC